jgi:hypothetical protein
MLAVPCARSVQEDTAIVDLVGPLHLLQQVEEELDDGIA